MLKKEFKAGYKKEDFYSIMGMFFAERKYRRELPYMVNTDDKSWVLFYEKECLAAFYAYEEKKDIFLLSGIYVMEEYRGNGVGTLMVEDALSRFPAVRIITNTTEMLSILEEYKFLEVSIRGSYRRMEWRKENGNG